MNRLDWLILRAIVTAGDLVDWVRWQWHLGDREGR